jgi:hypothetical protein
MKCLPQSALCSPQCTKSVYLCFYSLASAAWNGQVAPAPLDCSLKIVKLVSNPSPCYIVISHVWGPLRFDRTVLLNSQQTQITSFLSEASGCSFNGVSTLAVLFGLTAAMLVA